MSDDFDPQKDVLEEEVEDTEGVGEDTGDEVDEEEDETDEEGEEGEE